MPKKILSLVLVLVMLVPATLALAEERALEGNLYVTGLPIVKETESFTMLVDDSGKAEDKIMYPILEEQTGVKVELMLFPYETAREKMNILISSGDYPDVIGGWLLGENNILTDGMLEGLYIPIDELIEKYAPNMQKILEIPGVRQAMTLPDGHIYTIPYAIGEPLVTFLPFINRDWLKAVGMEMPKTTEELRTVLRAFKEKDPNGNGQADEIPFSGDPNNLNLGTLAGWFGVNATGAGANPYYAMVDGKLEFSANKEGFKEFIKYFSSLYQEGLVDPEIFTQDLEMWKSKGKQGLYGVSIAYGAGDFYDVDVATGTTPYDPLPVLKSDYTDQPIFRRNSYGVTIFRTQVAITDKAKNPATIIRWFDNVFELDNSVQIQAGLFGKRVEKLGEGQYRSLDELLMSEADREKYGWGNMFTQSLPKYFPTDLKILPVEGQPEKYDEKKTADALYEPYLDETIPQVWVSDQNDIDRAGVLSTDINNYVKTKIAEWVSGEKDIEAEWSDYVAQLDKLGLQELTEIKLRALSNVK